MVNTDVLISERNQFIENLEKMNIKLQECINEFSNTINEINSLMSKMKECCSGERNKASDYISTFANIAGIFSAGLDFKLSFQKENMNVK